MEFKYYYENDIFGFDDIDAKKKAEIADKEDKNDLPIKPFSIQWMMDVLARQKIGGRTASDHFFIDEVIFGDKKAIGSVRIKVTPNIIIHIQRQIQDMEGRRTWITKAVYKPDIKKYAGQEEQVAYDIFAEVEPIYFSDVEVPMENYEKLLPLTKRMLDRVRSKAPVLYTYMDTKEVSKDHYIIYFSLAAGGIGKLVSKRPHNARNPEAMIEMHYNRDRGLLHVILTTVAVGSGTGQGSWEVDIPYLDAWFSPQQHKDEIIDTVITSLKFY